LEVWEEETFKRRDFVAMGEKKYQNERKKNFRGIQKKEKRKMSIGIGGEGAKREIGKM